MRREPARTGTMCHRLADGRPRPGSRGQKRIGVESERLRQTAGAAREMEQAAAPARALKSCFCSECGAHPFSRNPESPAQMSVRMGVLEGDLGVRPSWRAYVSYAVPWEPVPDDGLKRFSESKPR